MTTTTVRCLGALTAVGGVLWGLALLFSPSKGEEGNSLAEIWASGLFQLGLAALLVVMWASFATGTGGVVRGILAAEMVALVLAMAWTVPFLFGANRANTGALVVLDAFWPLSMLGFLVVSVLVVRARRWPAPLCYLPLAAGLLIPVDLVFSWAPDDVRPMITGGYLIVAYGLVGLAVIGQAASLVSGEMREHAPG